MNKFCSVYKVVELKFSNCSVICLEYRHLPEQKQSVFSGQSENASWHDENRTYRTEHTNNKNT